MPIFIPILANIARIAVQRAAVAAAPLVAKGAQIAGKAIAKGGKKALDWAKKKLSKKKKDRDCPTGKCDKKKADPIKKDDKLRRQMEKRGWTDEQIDEAIKSGQKFPAKNFQTGGPATRYVHTKTGRSVIVDDTTKGIIHVGGDGFLY